MKTQLAIELSENAVRFASIEDGVVQAVDNFIFKDKIDYRYKEQLDKIFSEKGYKEMVFDEYSLSWYSTFSTILPNNVFAETNLEALFILCFSEVVPHNNIDYNRIPELGIVNAFAIPLWVKSFFVIKFPRIVIQHEGSHLLHGIFSGSTFNFQAVIILHETSFNLVITYENGLQFYSHFNFDSIDDVVYNFIFSVQQKNLLGHAGNLIISAGVGSNDQQAIELKLKLASLTDLKTCKISINSHLILNYQTLCV